MVSSYIYVYVCAWPFFKFMCIFIVVVITRPPEDTTVCRGSDVIINCGHNSTDRFDTVWSFNGSSFSLIVNGQVYRAINQTLIIFSINYTTTVQCAVHIRVSPPILLTSGTATVMVVGMYKYIMYVFMHNEWNACTYT